jgi:hypothetical protein
MSEQLSADLLIEPRWLLPMTPAARARGPRWWWTPGASSRSDLPRTRARFAVREQVRRSTTHCCRAW